jgi:O-antigen ligase
MHGLSEHPAWLFVFWMLLASLAVPSLLPSGAIGLGLLALVLATRLEACATVWRQTRWGWLLVGLSLLLGILSSDQPARSVKGVYDIVRGFGLFFVASVLVARSAGAQVLTSARLTFSLLAFLILGIALAMAAHDGQLWLRGNRLLQEHIGNLHEFANLAVIVALVLACLRGVMRQPKVLVTVALLAACVTVFVTTSKGNILALLFCLSLIFCVTKRKYLAVWLAVLLMFVLSYAYVAFLSAGDCLAGWCPGETLVIRKQIYRETLALVFEQPWLGHGLNTFKYVSGIRLGHEALIMPHSIYLELLFSLGIIGTILFVAGLAAVFGTCQRHTDAERRQPEAERFLRLFGLVLFVYVAVRGLVDLKLFSYGVFSIMAIALALMCARRSAYGARRGKPGG